MKRRGTIGILLLGLILITATACGGDDKETTNQQPAEGDINVTITADGNIEATREARLTFGSGGKVDKIYVKEGDKVNKDDILAKLDTSALELSLAQANVARAKAEIAIVQAQAGVIQAKVAITEAQVTLETAEYNLFEARDDYIWRDIKKAQADVDEAQRYLEDALRNLDLASGPGVEFHQKVVIHAQARLDTAKDILEAMLAGTDPQEVVIKVLEVELAEQSVELAKLTLEIARQSLSLAEQSLEFIRQSVELAQKQLEEATITAPFDGIVSKVGVKEGEFLSPAAYTGTTIVELIDPTHMELTARVDELDVVKVKTGQKVIISVDAVPEAKLEGRVTFISPVAREPVGVVLFEDEDEEKEYEVKIDFDIPENSPIRAGMSATAKIIIE